MPSTIEGAVSKWWGENDSALGGFTGALFTGGISEFTEATVVGFVLE